MRPLPGGRPGPRRGHGPPHRRQPRVRGRGRLRPHSCRRLGLVLPGRPRPTTVLHGARRPPDGGDEDTYPADAGPDATTTATTTVVPDITAAPATNSTDSDDATDGTDTTDPATGRAFCTRWPRDGRHHGSRGPVRPHAAVAPRQAALPGVDLPSQIRATARATTGTVAPASRQGARSRGPMICLGFRAMEWPRGVAPGHGRAGWCHGWSVDFTCKLEQKS